VDQPNNIDPEAWARFNEAQKHTPMEGRDHPVPTMVVNRSDWQVRIEEIAIEVVELPPAVDDLTLAVRRAASELHGLSEKSDRIAEQLYAALARFAKETGQP
jgi:hypothetical protein